MTDPNRIVKVPLNPGKFLNFEDLSLSRRSKSDFEGRPVLAAYPSRTLLPEVHITGKSTSKTGTAVPVKQIRSKSEVSSEKMLPEGASAIAEAFMPDCLLDSKEYVDNSSQIESDWSKYLMTRRKPKTIYDGSLGAPKSGSNSALTKSKISELEDDEYPLVTNSKIFTEDEAKSMIFEYEALTKSKVPENQALTKSRVSENHALTKSKITENQALTKSKITENPALTKSKITENQASPPKPKTTENQALPESNLTERPASKPGPPPQTRKDSCTQMDFSSTSTHIFHHTNPFFADGEFNSPLPLYREKLVYPTDSYYRFQDGGEGVNPFLDYDNPGMIAACAECTRPDSGITQSARALCDALMQRSNNELDEENEIKRELKQYEETIQLAAAASNSFPISVTSLESNWASWNHLYPPDTPSSYFTPEADIQKVYRNRRTNSAQSAAVIGTLSSPKFLSELRPSVSSISLVPAVFSEQSLPSDSGSRSSSFHSQSTSDDQNADAESEPEDNRHRKLKKKTRKRKGKESRGLSATSDLGSRIIDILNSYNNVEDTPDHVDLLLRNLPPSPKNSEYIDQPYQNPLNQRKPNCTASLPAQKTKVRLPAVPPKARPSQLININRKDSTVNDTGPGNGGRVRPFIRGGGGKANANPLPVPVKRNIIKENKCMTQYKPPPQPGVQVQVRQQPPKTTQLGGNRAPPPIPCNQSMFDQCINALGKAAAAQSSTSVQKITAEIQIKKRGSTSTVRLPVKKKSGYKLFN